MNITKARLKQIKEKLYLGAMEDIAKKTGYSPLVVGQILSGKRAINHGNSAIVLEAIKLIEKTKAEEEKLNDRITETLSK